MRSLKPHILTAVLSVLVAGTAESAHGAAIGVLEGSGCDSCQTVQRVEDFGRWLGRKVDWVGDYVSSDTWDVMLKQASNRVGYWGRFRSQYHLSLGVAMLPHATDTSLSEGADGAYDQYWRRLAEMLVADGESDADLRIGWEFNGRWYRWSAASDPEAFVAYWRRIVNIMRSTPGAHFTFDWNPSMFGHAIAPDSVYPGDDVVDIVGMDFYNKASTSLSAEERWNGYLTRQNGLDWLASFAASHRKPIAFPEWGTGFQRNKMTGGGDDAYFVRKMAEWISSHNVVYTMYFDLSPKSFDARISSGQYPDAAKAFIEEFGAQGQVSPPSTALR